MFAMEHNTLGTVVVFRNIAPLFTLAIERMFGVPFQFSLETVAALLSIVAGVVLYHLNSLGLTRLGLLAICLNMAFAVLERLMQRHLMAQSPVDINKPGMMLLNNACGLLPCGVLMVVYGEPARWHVVASELTAPGALLILISCLNGLAISYAGLKVQQLVTATTFMVLTNVNKFAVILFGVVVLHDDITLLSTAGVLLAIGGGLWYAKRARACRSSRRRRWRPRSRRTGSRCTPTRTRTRARTPNRGGRICATVTKGARSSAGCWAPRAVAAAGRAACREEREPLTDSYTGSR